MVEKKIKVVMDNRKARYDYFIEETYEAGIVLKGTEVKSLRAGRANLKDSYAQVQNGEMFLFNMHISSYEQGNRFNVDPVRARKLLLHKNEINRLFGKVMQQGLTLVPLQVYFKNGRVKVKIALVRGKKTHDKRSALAERDAQREIERAVRGKDRY